MEIQLNAIKKAYGERLVLDIDHYGIEKGQIMGIVGPNGAGKTTLLRILAGLDHDYEGHVTYDGQELNRAIQKKMTLVFQKPYLFHRSVYENIAYPLKIRKTPKEKIKVKVEEILNNLEITSLKQQNARSLSGGESQKVSLARALVFEPRLLLLDEPTSNIDPLSLEILEREIIRYNRKSCASVIIVTHSMEQAERLCDKIIYMNNGKVIK
ncbi:MAG: ABC transporter ATP-binding protein [Peptostreptococcales bacterium]|jgi:tungstate transport system ATP-binding protein